MCRLTVALWLFEPWPPPPALVALTAFFRRPIGIFVGCRRCSLKQRFSSTDPCSSAAGCNSAHFWGLNDRHVVHILIFKQMSYSYCEHCTCEKLSFFRIFGMMLDRCYSTTVEVRWVRMVIDEPAAFLGWWAAVTQWIAPARRRGWLTVAPYGKNRKTLNLRPAQ